MNKNNYRMVRPQLSIIIAFLLIGCQATNKKTDVLRNNISKIISEKQAVVGVSIIGNHGKDTLSLNGDKHCPMQSVFKMHIALTVLSEVDKGRFKLDQQVEVKKTELLPDTWSPLRDENPNGGSFTIEKLIQYAVSKSDNVACDVLIRLLGKPQMVEEYFKKNDINDIAIQYNEEEMQLKWENMFQNWTTPKAASNTLEKFYNPNNKILSNTSYDFFWKSMKETSTGGYRLRGLLPQETIVAHKTGTSGTNEEGLTAAINDIGIIFLPNGEYFIISVFVTDSKENEETNEKIIAEIAKATYDYYTTHKK